MNLRFVDPELGLSLKAMVLFNWFCGKSTVPVEDWMDDFQVYFVIFAETRFGRLRERIKSLVDVFGASEQDIEQVYNHILADLIDMSKKP